jgi:hypothetical protein
MSGEEPAELERAAKNEASVKYKRAEHREEPVADERAEVHETTDEVE